MPVLDVVGGSGDAGSKRPKKAQSICDLVAEEAAEIVTSAKMQNWAKRIQDLKKQQEEAKQTKKRLAKELKSAKKKTRRLKERARHLSEEDMMNILLMKRSRSQEILESIPESTAETKEGGQSSGSGAASTKASDFGTPQENEGER